MSDDKPKKETKSRMPLIIASVLALQVAISYALVTRVLFRIESDAPPADELALDKEAMGNVYLVPELVVNPTGSSSTRFIKVGFGFEVSSSEALEEIEARRPQVMDSLIRILTSKGLEDLDTTQEKDLLRAEIIESVNERMIAGEVTNVYLTDFVIQ